MEKLSIESAIASHPFFTLLLPNEIQSLAQYFTEQHYKPGDIIAKEGAVIDYIYLIASGFAEVSKGSIIKNQPGQVKIAKLAKGSGIGLMETGLFSKTGFRTANVIAITDLILYRINVNDLTKFIKSTNRYACFSKCTAYISQIHLIKRVTTFQKLSNKAISYLVNKIKPVTYKAGQYIFREGEVGSECYLIEKGSVDITRIDKQIHAETSICKLYSGALFGDMEVLTNAMHRTLNALAVEDCQLLVLDKKHILHVMDEDRELNTIDFSTLSTGLKINSNIAIKKSTNADKAELVELTNMENNETIYLDPLELQLWNELSANSSLDNIINKYSAKFSEEESQSLNNFLLKLLKLEFVKSSSIDIVYKKLPFYKRWLIGIGNLFNL